MSWCLFSKGQTGGWTLSQCIDTAIANNLNLLQSVNTVRLNEISYRQSKDNLLPTLNGQLDQSFSTGRSLNPNTNLYETGTSWNTDPSLITTLNLFTGLQYLNTIKQNQFLYQSSKYDVEDAKFNLTINVMNDFLQVLYSIEAVQIAKNQVMADDTQVRVTEDFVYVGKKTESQLLQIKSQLLGDRFIVVNAQSQLRNAYVALQQLLNLPVSDSFSIAYNPDVEPTLKTLEGIGSIYTQSLAFQPIIKSYQLKTRGALYAVKVAKGAYYPQLLFKGNIGTGYSSIAKQLSYSSTSQLENIGYVQGNPSDLVVGNVSQEVTHINNYPFANQLSDNFVSSFGVTLAVPIINYWQVRNNVKKQKVNLDNAIVSEQIVRLNLRKNVEQAYTSEKNSEAQYKAAKEEIDATLASYQNSMVEYKEGKMIASDLLVQKNAYIKALADYLQAKYGLLFNQKILDYYKGIPVTL